MPVLPTRASLLSARVGELREWALLVVCPCRGFPRHVPVSRLADEHGNLTQLELLLGRLRCHQCGRPPGRIEAKQGDPFGKRGITVTLLESRQAADRNRG